MWKHQSRWKSAFDIERNEITKDIIESETKLQALMIMSCMFVIFVLLYVILP